MPSYRAAHLQHTAYFKYALLAADQTYEQGGEAVDPALAQFDQDWPNIHLGQEYAVQYAAIDETAAQICSDYPGVGAHLLHLRQPRPSAYAGLSRH
jgi:hypothetical protein